MFTLNFINTLRILMTHEAIFQIDSETLWEDLGAGVSRKICGYDDKIMLVKVKRKAHNQPGGW